MPSFVERRASCHRAIDSRASSVDSRAIVSAIDGWIRLEIRLYICLEIRLAYWSRIIDIDSRYEFICRYFARMTTSLWLHTLVGPSIRNMYIYIVLIIDASSPRDDVPSSLHIRLCDQCICRLVIRVIVEYTILACITS